MNTALSTGRRAIVIYSPHAGRSAHLSHALTVLCQAGVDVADVLSITSVANTLEQGSQWKADGITMVVAAGGDGLVGGVTASAISSDLPVGIMPLGTANDLARSVGIPQKLAAAARVIASGTEQEIDIGLARPIMQKLRAELPDERAAAVASPPLRQQCLFVHALTVGLSVQFARLATNKAIRQRYRRLTYPLALWKAFNAYRPVEAELHFEGVARRTTSSHVRSVTSEYAILRGRIAQATAVNAPIFWGPFEAAVPEVSFSDRLLDMVVFEDTSRHTLIQRMLHFFSYASHQIPRQNSWHARYPSLLAAALTDVPGVHHVQARSVTIFTESEQQAVTLDGEVCSCTPIQARVANERLRLIVPVSSLRRAH